MITLITVITGCKKQAFVPDGSATLYLEAKPPVIEPGGTTTVIVTGFKENGYPLPDSTPVYLGTDFGEIDTEVSLVNGRAEALYRAAPGYSGEVSVTARSGSAQVSPNPLLITVADREVAYLQISADPSLLPEEGGTTKILAVALDGDMEGVGGKNLWLETGSGTLSPGGTCTTDSQGRVECTLTARQETTVTVKYKDLSASVTVKLEAENQPPQADFVYSPKNPKSGETVHFDASLSSDEDGQIVTYQWNFGDGKQKQGKTASHVYHVTADKTFVVVLTVTDDEGETGTVSKEITIDFI